MSGPIGCLCPQVQRCRTRTTPRLPRFRWGSWPPWQPGWTAALHPCPFTCNTAFLFCLSLATACMALRALYTARGSLCEWQARVLGRREARCCRRRLSHLRRSTPPYITSEDQSRTWQAYGRGSGGVQLCVCASVSAFRARESVQRRSALVSYLCTVEIVLCRPVLCPRGPPKRCALRVCCTACRLPRRPLGPVTGTSSGAWPQQKG
jgi:hypothetical protein